MPGRLHESQASRVKGVVFTTRRDFVRATYGRGAWPKILAVLRRESRDALSRSLKVADWYPLELHEELDRAICLHFAGGDPGVYKVWPRAPRLSSRG